MKKDDYYLFGVFDIALLGVNRIYLYFFIVN